MSAIKDKTVAVLMGGPGSERPVSLASGAAVVKALTDAGATVLPVDVTARTVDLPANVDVAFNVIHGTFGEDGELQQVMEDLGVPYTGEGVAGSKLAFDKVECKKAFAEGGVPTAGFEVLAPGQSPTLELPYVVKAPCEGSSVGVYIVKEQSEIADALAGVAELTDTILVEKFVAGRELTVGVLGDQALPVIEICPKDGFYDFRNKYPFLTPGGGADHYCPAALLPEQTARVQELALKAKDALGLNVYCRVDFLLPEDGEPVALEINTIPGMTESSLLPEAAGVAGIGFVELCIKIIDLSLARGEDSKE